MNTKEPDWKAERSRIMGLGESSAKKSYYVELQKNLEDLRASEADLRTLLDSTYDAILILGSDGYIVDANRSTLQLFGVTRDDVVGRPVSAYSAVSRPAARSFAAALEQVAHGGESLAFEWPARRADGREIVTDVAMRTAVWRQKRVVVAAIRDVTERRHAEQERKELEEQLAQARKMQTIGQLAGGVAHDFNNMLTPIMNYATLLRDDMPPDDPRRNDLNEILSSARRARDLTRQLLAYARQQKLALHAADLNEIVDRFQGMLRRTLRENIRIEVVLQPGLPAIQGDIGQIEQVILNLAVNGQDAMPDGGVLRIETRHLSLTTPAAPLPAGSYVQLIVADSGHGMDAETQSRIFEPFFTTKGLGRGTGLGLSTCYGIVSQHGGHISVESSPGAGARFIVSFPALATPQPVVPAAPAPPAVSTWDKRASGTVLLVEDQPEIVLAVGAALERKGYKVLTASNGDRALELVRGNAGPVDLLITDVIMEGIDGRELQKRMAELQPGIETLFISGYPADIIGRHGVLDPSTHFLPKPFTPAELFDACAAALAARREAHQRGPESREPAPAVAST